MRNTILIEISATDLRQMIREEVTKAVSMLKEDRFLTQKEAAGLIKKTPKTIRLIVKRGSLKEHQHDGRPRYLLSEVLNYGN